MKKILSLLLASTMVLTFAACGSSTQTPEDATAAGLEAFKTMDVEQINLYFDDADGMLDPDDIAEEEKQQYDLVMQNLAYTIKESKIDGDNATVTVDITNLDMEALMSKYISEIIQMALTEQLKPAAEQMAEEQIEIVAETLLYDMLGAEDAPMKTTENVIINLRKNDASWKIVGDEALADALTGGLMTVADQMSDMM